MTPYLNETPLQGTVVILEITEESFEQFLLLCGEVRDIVIFVEILQVTEDFICICIILIDIIKVSKEQLSPTEKLIERFLLARYSHKTLMKVGHTFQRIGNSQCGMLSKQFTNSDVGRTPHRLVCQQGQLLVQEERSPFVRKDDGDISEVVSVFLQNVFCNVFKKGFHFTSLISFFNTYHKYPSTCSFPICWSNDMYDRTWS